MVSSFRHRISSQRHPRSIHIPVSNADKRVSFSSIRNAPHQIRLLVIAACYIFSFILVCCFIYDECDQLFTIVGSPRGAWPGELIEYVIKAILIAAVIRLVCRLGLRCLRAYFYGFFYLRDVCVGVLDM
ncbi:hypothetical protein V1525DRAFT_378575 [Lipomyces kononenkoae]|uniref:Uncharacterized protein n=1 Tax=Lipomyces kononenkoae TaxID=34357 RepID=A0ACC3SYX8_LIPKO